VQPERDVAADATRQTHALTRRQAAALAGAIDQQQIEAARASQERGRR
jgi:hypothetical protein